MTHAPPPHRPPAVRRPRAAAPVIVQFGDTISIGGLLYTVTPTLTPAGAAPLPVPVPIPTPPPPPPPAAGHIAGFQAGTPVPVPVPAGGVAPGTLLTITGTGFGAPGAGAFGRVTIGGTEAPVKSWTPLQVTVIVPNAVPNPPAALLPVKLYWQASLSASPQLVANDGPLLLVLPGPALGRDAGPRAYGYRNDSGLLPAGPDFALKPGIVATLDGRFLGNTPGRLTWGGAALPVLGWSDQVIQFQVPAAPLGVLQLVVVTRADGAVQGFRGFTVLP